MTRETYTTDYEREQKMISKWGPEYFTFWIYRLFTRVRVLIFLLLVLLYAVDAISSKVNIAPSKFLLEGPEATSMVTKMIYLLLSIGAFTAAFITIAIGIIKKKHEAKTVTNIWSNLVKYATYPFFASMLMVAVLFLKDIRIDIPAPFPLFLLFVYLTINSIYTTVRLGEILVNEAFGIDLDEGK